MCEYRSAGACQLALEKPSDIPECEGATAVFQWAAIAGEGAAAPDRSLATYTPRALRRCIIRHLARGHNLIIVR